MAHTKLGRLCSRKAGEDIACLLDESGEVVCALVVPIQLAQPHQRILKVAHRLVVGAGRGGEDVLVDLLRLCWLFAGELLRLFNSLGVLLLRHD